MRLKSLFLTLSNISRTTSEKFLEVVNAGKVYKRDEAGNITQELDYVYAECAVRRGDTIKIKFPAALEKKIDNLRSDLENDVVINLSFDKLKLTPYALKIADGTVLSGVSGKADDFTIVSSTIDDIGEDIIM